MVVTRTITQSTPEATSNSTRVVPRRLMTAPPAAARKNQVL